MTAHRLRTGEWFISSPTMKCWISSLTSRILWCTVAISCVTIGRNMSRELTWISNGTMGKFNCKHNVSFHDFDYKCLYSPWSHSDKTFWMQDKCSYTGSVCLCLNRLESRRLKQRKLRPVSRKLSVCSRGDVSVIVELIIQSCTNLALLDYRLPFRLRTKDLSDLTICLLELDRIGHMASTKMLRIAVRNNYLMCATYDLELSRRLCIIKSSRAISYGLNMKRPTFRGPEMTGQRWTSKRWSVHV
jgi:hypothetical protein